ncbi:MAG: 2OG-Fe(II) oxygenase [Flavisolibacter sp.]
MSNKILSEPHHLHQWKKEFNDAKPFRYLVIDNFLDQRLADELASNFPGLNEMNVSYKGLNERKSEHSDFYKLPPVFTELKKGLSLSELTAAIEVITGKTQLQLIDDRFGFGLHQGGKDSFLDIHVDYNLHPTQRKLRKINFILFLNPQWEECWGGALEFWNKDVTVCEQSILPSFNRCVLFECNEYSFHGYSKINCPEGITRKSFYQYYFTESHQKIVFHDTIFKSTPRESAFKKLVVPMKENLKNLSKRLFYNLHLKRWLK